MDDPPIVGEDESPVVWGVVPDVKLGVGTDDDHDDVP